MQLFNIIELISQGDIDISTDYCDSIQELLPNSMLHHVDVYRMLPASALSNSSKPCSKSGYPSLVVSKSGIFRGFSTSWIFYSEKGICIGNSLLPLLNK